MICPKCGRPVTESAVICPGCDFILDSGFLGEEVLDEEKDLRPGRGGIEPAVFNLADAVILGDIDEGTQNFETSDTGFHIKESTGARLYVSGRSQALMAPDAIPARVTGQTLHDLRLTPFERHILNFIDGERPVEAIKRETGLDDVEVKTGLATLADKGVIRVVGRALVEIKPMEKKRERRSGKKDRMRRELVGAVALVGGESDQAIEDAFRTQTAIPVPDFDGPRPPRKPLHRPETDVFHKILEDHAPYNGRRENTAQPQMRSMTVDRDQASFLDSGEPDSLDRDLQRVLDEGPADVARTNQIDDGVFSAESDGFDEFGDASQLNLDSASESGLRPTPRFNRDLSSDLSETGSAPDIGGRKGPVNSSGGIDALDAIDALGLDADDDDDIFDEETAGALPKELEDNESMSFNEEFTAGTVARMNKSAIHRLAHSEIDQLSVDEDDSVPKRPLIGGPEPTRAVLNPLSESLSGLLSDDRASDAALADAAAALASPAAKQDESNPKPALPTRQATRVSALPASLLNESVDNFSDDAYSEIYDDLSSEEGESEEDEDNPLSPSSFAVDADDLPDRSRARPQAETTGLFELAQFEEERDRSAAARRVAEEGQMSLASMLEPSTPKAVRSIDEMKSDEQSETQSKIGLSAENPPPFQSDDFASVEDEEDALDAAAANAIEELSQANQDAIDEASAESSLSSAFGDDASDEEQSGEDVADENANERSSDGDDDALELEAGADAPLSGFDDSDESWGEQDPSAEEKDADASLEGFDKALDEAERRRGTEAVELSIDGSLGVSAGSSLESFNEADIVGGGKAPLEREGDLLSMESTPDQSVESLLPAPSFEMEAPAGAGAADLLYSDEEELAADGAGEAAASARSSGRGPPDAATDPHVSPLSSGPDGASADSLGPQSAEDGPVDGFLSSSEREEADEEEFDDGSTAAIVPELGTLQPDASQDSGATAIFERASSLLSSDERSVSQADSHPAAPKPGSKDGDSLDAASLDVDRNDADSDSEKTGAFVMPSSMESDAASMRPSEAPSDEDRPATSEAEDARRSDIDDDSADSGFEDEATAALDLNDISSLEHGDVRVAQPDSDASASVSEDSKDALDEDLVSDLGAEATHAFDAEEARRALGLDSSEGSGDGETAADAGDVFAADPSDEGSEDGSEFESGDGEMASDPEVTAHLANNPFDESNSEAPVRPPRVPPTGPRDADGPPPVSSVSEGPSTSVSVHSPLGPPPPSSEFMSDEGDDLGITDNVRLGDDADLEAYVPKNPATALMGVLSDVAPAIAAADGAPDRFRSPGASDGSLVDPPSDEGLGSANSEGKTGIFIPESSLVKRRGQSSSDPMNRPPAMVEASGFGDSHDGFPVDESENTRGADVHSAATGILDDDDEMDDSAEQSAVGETKAKKTLGSIADLDTKHLEQSDAEENAFSPGGAIRPAAPVAANLRAAANRVQRPVEDSGAYGAAPAPNRRHPDTENRASFAYSTDASVRPDSQSLLDELSELPNAEVRADEATDYARGKESNSRFESFPEEEHTVNIAALSSDESSLPNFNDATAAIEPLRKSEVDVSRSDVFATEQLPLPPRLAAQAKAEEHGSAKPRVGNGRGNAAPIGSDTDDLPARPPPAESPRARTGSRQGTDMIGKAAALFDDAMRDYQAGRIGAARMNAKLAAIYDPGNEEYRHALEQWERAPTGRLRQQVPPEVALYERAQEAESEGDVERALELLREGISLNPDVPAIHNRLGVLLALQKRDYDAAAASIRRAIELEPDNLHYKNNLGKIVARSRAQDAY